MINFIGTGSAFNTELGNTSAFIKNNTSLLLIDCGGTVFHNLQKLKLLEGVENLYIIITHMHPDHIGSLGDVVFYSYYILKQRPTILFPKKQLIDGFLKSVGVGSKMYRLNGLNLTEINDKKLGDFRIEFISVTHVIDTMPAYGFLMNFGGKEFYYSGDSNNINNEIIDKMKHGEITRIYQDTCGLDYEGNGHLSLKKLCEIIPKEFRNKIYCMHLDKYITEQKIEDEGFNTVKKWSF